MNIDLLEITIRELAEGYNDGGEGGVTGYGGHLDIRPPLINASSYTRKNEISGNGA